MIKLKKTKEEFEDLIDSKNITQTELAESLGVNKQRITDLKKKKKQSIGRSTAKNLCTILGVEFAEWFER